MVQTGAKIQSGGLYDGLINNDSLEVPIRDFYMTNPITRASHTMSLCKSEYDNRISN